MYVSHTYDGHTCHLKTKQKDKRQKTAQTPRQPAIRSSFEPASRSIHGQAGERRDLSARFVQFSSFFHFSFFILNFQLKFVTMQTTFLRRLIKWQVSRHRTRQSQRLYHELSFETFGEPTEVISYRCDSAIRDDDPGVHSKADLIKVEMFHVPWNPADVNTVQGKYPSPYGSNDNIPSKKSRYFDGQTVLGSEGWGKVVSSTSLTFPEGSLVTVGKPGIGTLRSSFWVPESCLLRVPDELLDHLGPAGCTLFQLGGTALRMLTDFVPLQRGDIVIQNAGNSGVALLTSQLASTLLATPVVSLVRRQSKTDAEFEELVKYLESVGKNALVVAEEDLMDRDKMKEFQSQLRELSGTGSLPKLALNAVGGDSAKHLLKAIEPGGTMVTYGGMSGKPVIVNTPELIFKDVRVVGYWHSRWMVRHCDKEKQQMVDDLAHAVLELGVECPPARVFPIHDTKAAFQWLPNQGAIRSKLVWDCKEHTGV